VAVDLRYSVETQYPTVEFLGGTQTRDVVAVGITTKGHGVYIEFRIPVTTYTPDNVKSNAIGYTGTIENAFTFPGVQGVSWGQSPDAAGELVDQITYTVVSDSGNSSAQLTLPLSGIGTSGQISKLKNLLASLNESEGLTG
jgi:hypothetical protein